MTKPNPIAVAKYLGQLLGLKILTPHDYAVGMTLLWRCRPPGRVEAQVSFDRLAKLAGVGRTAAVAAVRKLRDLGILAREKTRLRVAWSLGIASRQWRNIYRWFLPADTAVASPPTDQVQVRKKDAHQQERWLGRPLLPIRTVEEQLALLRIG
jgi:hypothetical protein